MSDAVAGSEPALGAVNIVKDAPSKPAGDPKMGSDASTNARAERKARDQALVERAKAGDRAAFRDLYEHYHRRAFAVALGVVGNPQDARDVVQDAFVKVHRHLERFQGNASFYTWLYRIVMNLSIDHVRRAKKKRNQELDETYAGTETNAAGDGALLPTMTDRDPAQAAQRKQLREAIAKALETLPEYHRAVILLREVEGLSYEEMAEALEVPKGTIMSRLYHARRKMQDALKEVLNDPTPLSH